MTIVVTVWSLSIVTGLMWMAGYTSHPIDNESFPSPMPAGVLYPGASGQQPRFVVFSHPQCSCTRTTLQQLARLISHYQTPIQVSFLFNKPAKPDKEQTKPASDSVSENGIDEAPANPVSDSYLKSENPLLSVNADFSCEFNPASNKLIQVSNQ